MDWPARSCRIEVADQVDCKVAQVTAREFAKKIKFPETSVEEIVLVAAELASNLIRHAGSGSLTFSGIGDESEGGIEIESLDEGPGIADVEQVLEDGYSTAGGLGFGLGAVNRLMDELEVNSAPELGTRIAARRWKREAPERTHRWDIGAATRSRFYAASNGDAFVIKEWGDNLLVGLIDGLGHGDAAQAAALEAQRYVLSHYDRPLDAVFEGVGRACRGTRGVVMALARFRSAKHVSFGTLGNIESREWCGDIRHHFVARRGVLGAEIGKAQVQESDWEPGWILALHSDGIRSSWEWSEIPFFEREPAQAIARWLLLHRGKEDDDATAVVVRA